MADVQVDDLSIRLSSTLDSKLNSDLKSISDSLGKMQGSLGKIGKSTAIGGLKNFSNGIKGLSNSFRPLSRSLSNGTMGLGGFTKAVIVAKSAIWALRSGMGFFSDSIDLASNLVEVNNIIDHVFGNYTTKIEEVSKKSVEAFGISELTFKRTAGQFQAMASTMGITDEMVTNATQSMIDMGKALNEDGKYAYESTGKMQDMATSITEWVADIASFYDMDYSEAATKAQSIFTGTTRPLTLVA